MNIFRTIEVLAPFNIAIDEKLKTGPAFLAGLARYNDTLTTIGFSKLHNNLTEHQLTCQETTLKECGDGWDTIDYGELKLSAADLNYNIIGAKKSCLKLVTDLMTFDEAQANCETHGGFLIEPYMTTDLSVLHQFLTDKNYEGSSVFLGYSDESYEKYFVSQVAEQWWQLNEFFDDGK